MLARTSLASLAVLSLASAASAAVSISSDHVDVGIGWDGTALDPHWHQEDLGLEYAPDEAYVVGNLPAIATTGSPGFGIPNSFYAFPEVKNLALPFLGIGAEEVATGVFTDDKLTLKLTGLTGPAGSRFWLYRTDAGNPLGGSELLLDSSDLSKSFAILAGSHGHAVWAFDQPGEYGLTLQWTGNLVSGGALEAAATASGTFTFVVAPEPGTMMAALGAGALALARKRR
jgi:surface-anchored protein